jgi:drug/metabolite transporter (DMT)-like permease
VTASEGSVSRARALIIAGAALFSTGGLAIKLCSLTPWQIAAFRPAVAAVALAVLFPGARRAWSRRSLLVALPYAATIILFTLATRATTAAHAIFLQDTAPLYLLLLSPWILGERINRGDLWFASAMAVGMLLLFAGTVAPAATAPDPARGNALAMASGLTWALTLMGLRWLAAGPEGHADAALGGALAGNTLAALIAAWFAFPVLHSTALDWVLIGYLGLFQIGCAYALVAMAMPRLPALEASLLLLVEPVLNPLWVWLALGERIGAVAIAGCAVILGATALRYRR